MNLSGYDNIETDRGSPPGIPRLLSMIANPENINDNPRLYTTSIQELSASFTNYHGDLTGKTGSPINNCRRETKLVIDSMHMIPYSDPLLIDSISEPNAIDWILVLFLRSLAHNDHGDDYNRNHRL